VHPLTKIFVLVSSVLALLLSALTVSYAVNTDKVLADYRNALARESAAIASSAAGASQSASKEQRLAAQIEQLQRDNASASAQVRTLEAERATLLTERNKSELARQGIDHKLVHIDDRQRQEATLQQQRQQIVAAQGGNIGQQGVGPKAGDVLSFLIVEGSQHGDQSNRASLARRRDRPSTLCRFCCTRKRCNCRRSV
jgi:hypothetical protein